MYEPVAEEEIVQNVYPAINGEEKQCRICLESTNPEDLIHPCLCRGFSRYVHRHCLDQWRVQNNHQHFFACDICHYEYRISRVWWARFISHKATSIIGTLVSLPTIGMIAGYGSASLYNLIYYWFMHDIYHTPHRLQTLFHCLMWLGIPGIMGLIRSAYTTIRDNAFVPVAPAQNVINIDSWVNLLASLARSNPSVVHHYHHDDAAASRQRRRTEEKKEDDEDEDKEDKEKKKKKKKSKPVPVAECPQHSATLVVVLVTGTMGSFYYTFRWMYKKCLAISRRCAEYIQNVE